MRFRRNRIWAVGFAAVLMVVLAAGCGKERPASEADKKAEPEQLRLVERLNAAADEMYRFALDGDIIKARDKLQEIGERMTQIRFEGITSVEGVSALNESIVEAKRVFNAVKFSHDEGQRAAAKIRLATDALTHVHQPMWLQYYKVMKEDVYRLEKAEQEGNRQEALHSLEQLNGRYGLIRPSLLISREPSDVEKLDSLFTFLNNQFRQAKWDSANIRGGLGQLHGAIDEVFRRRDAAAYVPMMDRPNPTAWILAIGSIIALVLSFAAWRIFRFERTTFGGRSRRG